MVVFMFVVVLIVVIFENLGLIIFSEFGGFVLKGYLLFIFFK